jgi:hypothetical protein
VATFFAYLEANAEEYWQAPSLRLDVGEAAGDKATDDDIPFGDPAEEDEASNEEQDSEFEYDYEYDLTSCSARRTTRWSTATAPTTA